MPGLVLLKRSAIPPPGSTHPPGSPDGAEYRVFVHVVLTQDAALSVVGFDLFDLAVPDSGVRRNCVAGHIAPPYFCLFYHPRPRVCKLKNRLDRYF